MAKVQTPIYQKGGSSEKRFSRGGGLSQMQCERLRIATFRRHVHRQ
jgi:hypothetical protein